MGMPATKNLWRTVALYPRSMDRAVTRCVGLDDAILLQAQIRCLLGAFFCLLVVHPVERALPVTQELAASQSGCALSVVI